MLDLDCEVDEAIAIGRQSLHWQWNDPWNEGDGRIDPCHLFDEAIAIGRQSSFPVPRPDVGVSSNGPERPRTAENSRISCALSS